ncbi:hypothetical protein [Curtobacterium sp. MCPF17_052]|uniref:hypothetical protein n=1 Tax=Curtobacterium sp. MCPF17_052 TaxID=2175655 RepID=UPI0024DF796F|nr:hypothetical protein [Curtobacterium sp. MCPF17_052]WIB13313.1 hypothetical protein DEJ36_05565 [Curtobacterium sp. MCPF17_052]
MLGDGIKKDKQYATPSSGRLALPRQGPGVERLRATLDSGIPEVPPEVAREAWARLLNAPAVISELPHVAAESGTGESIKRLLLAAVFKSVNEKLSDGEISHPRFAVKAELTLRLRLDGGRRTTSDAWLTAEWFDTTRALLSALDDDADVRTRAPGTDAQRVDVVFAADRVHWADGTDMYEAIERIAHLSGMRVRILFLSGANYATTQARLRSEQPTHLLFIGANGIDEVRAEFEARGRGPAHVLAHEERFTLLNEFREKLPRIAGIAANLMLYSAPAQSAEVRPPMPAIDAARCLHVNNRIYVLDSVENVWWTRDDAHHAKVQFKTYALQHETLHWRADHDAEHVAATAKHKGSGTLQVPIASATSCGRPRSHL